ncbi:MAG: Uma2 family endonuclease [Candidatus Pacearchaeota archaeon]
MELSEIKQRIQPLSLEDYQALCELEPERYARTELFRGVIIQKMTKSSEHDYFSQIFAEEIRSILPKEYFLRTEKGVQTQDSELEPDISVIFGSPKDYKHKKPKTARLIVEIAVSSLEYDREKAIDYAQTNVEEYWIVDINNEVVEVCLHPTSNGYNTKKIYHKTEKIPLFEKELDLAKLFE